MGPESQSQPPNPPPPRRGLAIASLVFGILGLLLSLAVVGGAFALAAIALGLVHLVARRGPKVMAIWGICLSLLALPVSIGMGFIAYKGFQAARIAIKTYAAGMTNYPGGTNWGSVAFAPLTNANKTLTPTNLWSVNISGAQALTVGDWDGDGQADILVADFRKKLHVLNLSGVETTNIALPSAFRKICFLRNRAKGPRVAGHDLWGNKVTVVDASGREVWNYKSTFGFDGAQSGDLDGDGTDELIVGMNGFGGLHAVSPDGKKLWSLTLANVWDQSVISAVTNFNREPLVLATEASGSVRLVDGKGNLLRAIKPNNAYCTIVAGAAVNESNTVQILAIAQSGIIACDENGAIAWATAVTPSQPGAGEKKIACGDVDGDGVLDWAFVDAAGDIVVVNTDGAKLATLTGHSTASTLALVAPANQPARLVVLQGGKVQAYGFW